MPKFSEMRQGEQNIALESVKLPWHHKIKLSFWLLSFSYGLFVFFTPLLVALFRQFDQRRGLGIADFILCNVDDENTTNIFCYQQGFIIYQLKAEFKRVIFAVGFSLDVELCNPTVGNNVWASSVERWLEFWVGIRSWKNVAQRILCCPLHCHSTLHIITQLCLLERGDYLTFF